MADAFAGDRTGGAVAQTSILTVDIRFPQYRDMLFICFHIMHD